MCTVHFGVQLKVMEYRIKGGFDSLVSQYNNPQTDGTGRAVHFLCCDYEAE